MTTRRVRDAEGTTWEASEGYSWAPKRQKEPAAFIVFRAGGHERRADGTPPLERMTDGELAALLAGARERSSAPALVPALLARSRLLERTLGLARAAA
jgi:hypothetical protein